MYSFQGKKPKTHESVFIAPGASVIGDVTIGKESSVWFNAVLRGDEGPITIGQRVNIQDNSTGHLYPDFPLTIEDDVTVGHNVILHGCTIKKGSLIGMGSTILDGVEIGEYCFIAANSLIPPGKKIPDYSFVMGSPGKVVREVSEKDIEMLKDSAQHYAKKAQMYLDEKY
jgi:carbonic anhydrase/acetyltransferase-like protein (isoleucine patch superfamily)